MAANKNLILSGGKADGCSIRRLTTARTSVATIASPAQDVDMAEIFVAGTNGGFVNQIGFQFVGTGTQAATLVYFWLTNTSGTNAELDPDLTQVVAAMAVMSNTAKGTSLRITLPFHDLAAGRKMFATVPVLSANCELIVDAKGGQFEEQ